MKHIVILFVVFLLTISAGCSGGQNINDNSPVVSVSKTPEPSATETVQSALPTVNDNTNPLPDLQIENANFDAQYFIVNNESIFYLQNDRLCSARIDGTNIKEMDKGCCWYGLALDDNYLYYLKPDGFYRISLNGEDKEKLFTEHEVHDFQVIGNQIIYQASNNIHLFDMTSKQTEEFIPKQESAGLLYFGSKIY